ncbi:hypothetical protein ACFL42_03505 [Candidatus Omnitrophota bacterium]
MIRIIALMCIFMLCSILAGHPAAYAQTGEIEYLKAAKYFNKCWKEENPRVAFGYLRKARQHAKAALEYELDKAMKAKVDEIIGLSENYDIDKLEESFKEAVKERVAIKWMTKAEVKECLGRPDKKKIMEFGTREEWIYEDGRMLSFKGNYLIEAELPDS